MPGDVDEDVVSRIVLAGDLNVGGDFGERAGGAAAAIEALRAFRDITKDAAMVFGNLEGPLTARASFKAKQKHIGNPTWAVDALAGIGFTTLSLANNHLWDFGEDALRNTVESCRSRIQCVGAGASLAEARSPAIVRARNGTVICLIAFSDVWNPTGRGPAGHDEAGFFSLHDPSFHEWIDECVRAYDVVIAYAHWGYVGLHQPTPAHRRIALNLLKRGVKVVCASHCHHIQGIEQTREGLIAYGLGDLVFPRFLGNGLHVDLPWPHRISFALEVCFRDRNVSSFNIIPWFFHRELGLVRLAGPAGLMIKAWTHLLSAFDDRDYDAWYAKYNSRSPTAPSRKLIKRIARIATR